MSGFFGCHDQDPCNNKPQNKDCGCNCTEDPSIRSLRKRLCRLENNFVVIISDNFFSITFGTVDRVTCGTVELTDATVFFVVDDIPRVVVPLSKINLLIPVPDLTSAAAIATRMQAAARLTGLQVQ